jgi:hypothetical protein
VLPNRVELQGRIYGGVIRFRPATGEDNF